MRNATSGTRARNTAVMPSSAREQHVDLGRAKPRSAHHAEVVRWPAPPAAKAWPERRRRWGARGSTRA
jgi:hypothetical protein